MNEIQNITPITVLAIYLVIISLITFVLYGVDKYKAVHHRWRIPEATLIGFCAAGGAAGGLVGMLLFHHKTRKWKFRILVPLFLVLWIVVISVLI